MKAVTATTVAAGAASTPATAQEDYDEIVVGTNETFTKNVGTGETWENKLIDISALGATYQIQADGTDWTIRNIGITGNYEGGHTEPFRARVTDSDGTGRIENVCLDVTCGDSNATGLYVYWNHAGHLELDRFNVQSWTDNGIYASGPGNSDAHSLPGAGGTVAIRNSYSKNNDKSNFRLGTHGSKLVNCCAAGGSSRGHWQFYESAEIIDCDLGGHTSDIALGDAVWEKSNYAAVDCTNSRWESEHAHGGASTSNITGTSQGTPRDYVPEGCPTSAEEAASGGSGGGGDSPADPDEVAEDFEHADVPGTYSGDTGSFTTSSTRATSGSYSLTANDGSNGNAIILRDDMQTSAGNTYGLDAYFPSASGNDMGVLFGAQSGTSWSTYTGYFGLFESDDDEIRIDRWDNGSQVASSSTPVGWPTDEWLTAELDYRETDSSTLTMTVSDASGSEVASVSLSDTTYDSGTVGWYNWHSTSDWFADTWYDTAERDDPSEGTVLDDFEDGDVDEYAGYSSTFVAQSTTTLEGSYTLEATDTWDRIGHTDATTPRGNEYRCQILAPSGSGAEPSLLVSVQDPANPLADCYWVHPNVSAGTLTLWRRENGSSYQLDSVAYSVQEGTIYQLAIELGSDTVKAVLYDDAGTRLAETATITDATHTGGTVGFYAESSIPAYWDHATKNPL